VVETASEAEVQFILGSSRQGRSYLVNQHGYLFQSPISWFSSKKIWGPAPGYEEDQMLFARQITEQCLYCHSNGVAPVSGAINHFPEPVFKGYGIGCERCHGPGQLHADSRRRGIKPEGVDYTIVNPRQLEPLQRDAVCEQCHLLGEARITRRGRSMQDFRPGLPIHEFVSVFVKPTETLESQKSVSELHQLYMSTCFIKSAGKMGCISCHDPHGEPAPRERTKWYRDCCLECHADKGCTLPVAARKAVTAEDSCIACHMPGKKSEDIPHAAVSDHRIPRKPDRVQSSLDAAKEAGPPLRYFHEGRVPSVDRDEVQRDLGLAMIEMSLNIRQPEARPQIARQALPLLEAAVARAPDDQDAQAALGYALGMMDSNGAALTVLDKVLSRAPHREDALIAAANFATAMGRTDAAVGYFERLIKVNPWLPSYRYAYAKVLHQRQEWRKAIEASREAVRLDPINTASRRLLTACLVAHGEQAKAAVEFRILQAITPKAKDELQRWFDSLPR
jgi:predicted CXXCH cytochrome family protein